MAVVVYGSQYGTGWWVAKDTLVTAAHVVSWTKNATVTVIRGDWKTSGVAVYVNAQTDIAVIRTEGMPLDAHVYPVASRVDEQRTLYVIGYPYELVQIEKGDLASASNDPRIAKGFSAWYNHNYHLIEFQATTDAGNSGGPVIYSNGAVVGLVSFALTGKAGVLYFASDADAIRAALDKAGVHYETMEPPAEEAANINSVGDLSTGNRQFWVTTIALSAIISIAVTAIWLSARG